ncbi:helix-turn-helix transcriptional regulator [Lactobacillus sp.]|uniref:helix-turn-helix domain-containing protein n=1 Tax=Lactobacillus sp. TaxID=1591 RepID=UPI0019CEE71A|nr:helix-turn-helix transcriptional regulator [Lactobacillus sp.]MBD5429652.1 helix-turn-helix transcriptional regulator [Lactobacillus sp.]
MKANQILKTAREIAGISQQEVCEGIISESYYSKIERGVHQVDADIFFKIINKNYLPLNMLDVLNDGILDSKYMNNIQKDITVENFKNFYKQLKAQKIKISASHYLATILYLYIYHKEIIPDLDKEDTLLLQQKKKKILNNPINIHSMRQAVAFSGLLNEEEFLQVVKASRKYTSNNLNKYVIGVYLNVVNRFVSNLYIGQFKLNSAIKDELKEIQAFIKTLLPNDYSLAYQKISITLGINTVLQIEDAENKNKLLREVLTMSKPNLSWIKNKNTK